MSEIHRSYQVLIEETVSDEERQQKNGTSKQSRFNPKTIAALKLTSEMFQDAVCYYTLMLAGMVKDAVWTDNLLELGEVKRSLRGKLDDVQWAARKKEFSGRHINPLWAERCVGASSVLERLNKPHYRHAAFRKDKQAAKTVAEIVENAFRYQGEEPPTTAPPGVKVRSQTPPDQILLDTFLRYVLPGCLESKGAKLKLKSMKSAAGEMTGKFCSPAGDNNLPGTGVYKKLHSTTRRIIDESPAGQLWLQCKKDRENAKGDKQARDTADLALKKARDALLDEPTLIEAAVREVVNAAQNREAANQAEDERLFRERVASEIVSPNRNESETEKALHERVKAEFQKSLDAARESTLESYRRAFREGRGANRLLSSLATIQAGLATVSAGDLRIRRIQEGSKKNQGEDFQVFFRLLWLANHKEFRSAAAADVLAYAIDHEPIKSGGSTLPYQSVSKDEPLFPFFTNSLAKDEATRLYPAKQAVWDGFDTPAFKRATEEFFKYAIHTHERQKKVNGLRDFIGCFTGEGRKSAEQPKPKKRRDANAASEPEKPVKPRYAAFGMKDDPRKGRIEELLQTLGKGRGSGESGYGLRFNTIGGWAYLRPEWLKTHEQAEKAGLDEEGVAEQLVAKISEIRDKVGGGFGSDDVFKALCETDNHILWLDGQQTQEWHAPDFVAHYARYTSKLEDLRAIANEEQNWKPEAINFTWPGEEHAGKRELSFRPFDFKCDICTQPVIKLFSPTPDGIGVRIVETNNDPEFPLTLSFRRLKRDRIVLPDGTSWESFWSPPKLAVGESLPPPLAGPIVKPREVEVEALVSLLDRLPAAQAVSGDLADIQESSGELSKLLKANKKERDAGKIDAARLAATARILHGMHDDLANLRKELLEAEKLTKQKDKADQMRETQQGIRTVLSDGLNRLVSSPAKLYEKIRLSKPDSEALANDPRQFHHRMQNRRCLEMVLNDALQRAKGCFNENVSLLAPKHPNGAFHFMFAVKVDPADLEAFQVQPSVPGEKPYRLTKQGETKVAAYLRWPVDLDSERESFKKQKQNGEAATVGEDDDEENESSGRGLPAAKELWCNTEDFKQKGFHTLFVDLGVRFAGGWSRAWIREARGAMPATSHLISSGTPDIWCQFYDEGAFRLQGEDAKVWHRVKGGDTTANDVRCSRQEVPKVNEAGEAQWPDKASAKDGWMFGRELYGSRGRLASPEEVQAVLGNGGLAERLFPQTNRTPLPENGTDARRFVPAMAEHLVMRLDRRLSRIGFLFTLRWRLEGEKERDPKTGECTLPRLEIQRDAHNRIVVESLAAKDLHPEGEEVEDVGWNTALREALADNQTWASVSEQLKTKKPRKKDKRREHERKLEQAIKQGTGWRWKKLADAVHEQLMLLLGELGDSVGSGLLAQVADYAWPLRDKAWHWQSHRIDPSSKSIPSKLVREIPKEPRKGKIIGQGGLNMTRIELLQKFSRCCASLAWHEERFNRGRIPGEPGVEPPPLRKRGEGPKPCEDLLEKIDQLRDQRVEQTAALILAEALGLELQSPADVTIDGLRKWQLKSERDVHGRYQRRELKPAKAKELAVTGEKPFVPQCAMIVVEDLSRYRTSLDRSRFENRRLMDWSHRAIIKKLKDMAQVFGVEIVAVNARYSSRYCSKAHVPGVRVAEIRSGFDKEQPWRRWKDEKAKGKPTERAARIAAAIKHFENGYDGGLIVELEGGPLFLACNGEQPVNADINASRNIGFRAVAHPDLWHFFPVLRTETDEDGNLRIANWRGTLAAKPNDDPARVAKPTVQRVEKESKEAEETDGDEGVDETSAKPYLFISGPVAGPFLELPSVEEVFTAKPQSNGQAEFRVAKGKLFWSRVTTACHERIKDINDKRIADWKAKLNTMSH